MHLYKKSAYLFLLPMLVGLLVFRLIPIVMSFLASFTDWNVYSPPKWIGLDNYKQILASAEFWEIMKRTAQFAVIFTAGVCVIGLFFAVLLNEKMRGIRFFRAVFFLPVITSVAAVGLIWNWMLSPQGGLLNALLKLLEPSVDSISWLGDKNYALYSLAFVYVWKSVGYQTIIFIAGLQAIPHELREAAKMDGAGPVLSFFRVTLPLLTPTLFFVLVITVVESLNTFGITYTLTEGGPYNSSTTLSYYIFQNAFVHYRMGYASGLSYVLFLITVLLTGLNFWLKRKWVNY
ncbi:sugar ABC transporter permease [Paenibacillus filicis]|uniref:Sugar ABC transporter permease n=1 Tax=Paenibacillus gyeongsangnamensis TaxID=3388067 RepID=A0ABT4QGX2_9BACL|nr:sugar ABC transporter permease [Paenibacillus filicis]MCZ8516058.1 sugar ABC transporter permease [Paenibacillus filicis]